MFESFSSLFGFGKKKKTTKKITISKKGSLSKYGYSSSLNATKRHTALKKAVIKSSGGTRHERAVRIMRRLNALSVLHKNKNPSLSRKFKADSNWIRRNLY